MQEAVTVKCIDCNRSLQAYEYSKFSGERRYKVCDSCRAINAKKYVAEMISVGYYEYPKTTNSWPFYGSGDQSLVKPPLVYYDQMLHSIGKIRSGYKLEKMTNVFYKSLRKEFEECGLAGLQFPAVINERGRAVWRVRIDDLSVVALYSMRYYMTAKEWKAMMDKRIAKIERRPEINYRRKLRRKAQKEALGTKGITPNIIAKIMKSRSAEMVRRIVKDFEKEQAESKKSKGRGKKK